MRRRQREISRPIRKAAGSHGGVDLVDFDYWTDEWLCAWSQVPGDLDRDGMVDMFDFVLLGRDWLLETSWRE
ncbi:MAG: hypothetical protein ACYS76_06815 [Planctomycetota bacterium]